MQVACLRCHPARKPLRRFSTLRRFPPFLPCRTPVRSISDTHPVDIGHRSGPNRTPFRSHRKTVRHQPGRLSDFNRNTVRFESERCPTSNRIGVRFASEYASHHHSCARCIRNGSFFFGYLPFLMRVELIGICFLRLRDRGKLVSLMTVFRSHETKPDSECLGPQAL